MKYFIDQPGCLGDIIFTLNFAEQLSKEAEVYWHISPAFWESGIKKVQSPATLGPHVSRTSDIDKVYKLCDMVHRGDSELMRGKYTHYGYDWSNWASSIKYERDHETENDLRKHFGLEKGDPFIVYNDCYGSDKFHNGVVNSIPDGYDGKVIKLEVFNEATVFDWGWIFENAEQIHTVDTSILYVIESLDIKSNTLSCHPRHYKFIIPMINNLFKKPWNFVEYDRDTWRKCCPDEAE